MSSFYRKRLYGLIHQGAFRLEGIDDDISYRELLKNKTSKSSCKEMNMFELNELIDWLKTCGVILSGYAITSAQRYKIKQLADTLKLSTEQLDQFCIKTTKRRFTKISRKQASKLINGLESWIGYNNKKIKTK